MIIDVVDIKPNGHPLVPLTDFGTLRLGPPKNGPKRRPPSTILFPHLHGFLFCWRERYRWKQTKNAQPPKLDPLEAERSSFVSIYTAHANKRWMDPGWHPPVPPTGFGTLRFGPPKNGPRITPPSTQYKHLIRTDTQNHESHFWSS
jgi:hypothetical protein